MENIIYQGEHVWPGLVGQFFILLAFSSALFSFFTYYFSFKKPENNILIPRLGFGVHIFGVIGIAATLFYLLTTGYFEYDYVYKHSNTQMPGRYLFAAFWEGQEGSFILWLFWQALLGALLIFSSKQWEKPVMIVVSLAQIILTTMLLGVFVGEHRIGSNPFLLMREMPENAGLPWTFMADYLTKIPQFAEGRGLNPLLQNYWMTIHPPVLFLGFSLTLIPFAFAIAGLWKQDFVGWMKAAKKWAFATVAILGLGILMGGAWAYEALSFGGFWAWDPVENASLVPWLFGVGAAHLMLLNIKKPTSLYSTLIFTALTYITILYSTFLTRSGILGETSVHSFTDNGMTGQLLVFLLGFFGLFTASLIGSNRKRIVYLVLSLGSLLTLSFTPYAVEGIWLFILLTAGFLFSSFNQPNFSQQTDETLWSREFWMFIGAICLMLSALQISFSTSVPVINALLEPFSSVFTDLHQWTNWSMFEKLANAQFAPPAKPIEHYNQWQVPFAFLVAFFIAISQHLKYKKTDFNKFLKQVVWSFGASLISTVVLAIIFEITFSRLALLALLLGATFAFFSNLDYFFRILKGRVKNGGSSLAHAGFALILLGSAISAGQSDKISDNSSGIDVRKLNEEFSNADDILLFKNDTLHMDPYFVSYQKKIIEGINVLYEVEFFKQVGRSYKDGELVASGGQIYKCTGVHDASESFFDDEAYWQHIPQPTFVQLKMANNWSAYKPGEKDFTLHPRIQLNPTFGNVPEPDTKHYPLRDVFTHVRWAELKDPETTEDGYLEFKEAIVKPGDTIYTSKNMVVFKGLSTVEDKKKFMLLDDDLAAKATLTILTSSGKEFEANPLFIIRDEGLIVPDIAEVPELKLKFSLPKIDPDKGEITVAYSEHIDNRREFIVFQAIVFPWINILWIGCIMMVVGTLIAVFQRKKAK